MIIVIIFLLYFSFGSVLGLACQPDLLALGPDTKARPSGSNVASLVASLSS